MEKAYAISELVKKLKNSGLDLAEDAAVIVVESIFEWVEESAKISSTPYDDMALIILPNLKKMALSQIDKIDGKSEV